MTIPDQIAAIQERHEDYWRSADALKEAIAAWGAEGHVNDCGVFMGYKLETIATCGRAVAEVGVYKLREDVFLHCCHFTSATSGFGYAPSVWSSTPHETAKQARLAGIVELLERIGDGGSEREQRAREEVRKVRRQIEREIEQPSLF